MPIAAGQELRDGIRSALLPVAPEREDRVVEAVATALARADVAEEDAASWLLLELTRWREEGRTSPGLQEAVYAALTAGDQRFGERLAPKYFDIHEGLQRKHFLTHDEACILLSHSLPILRLAADDRCSSAQIAELLTARGVEVASGWKAIDEILRRLKTSPRMEREVVQKAFALDQQLEEAVFADADVVTAIEIVEAEAERLGYDGDLSAHLTGLLADDPPFWPYLQILHYQAMILEQYDHPASYLYVFSPRGLAGQWLFAQYPDTLVEAGNPFLNNAKSVDVLSRAWARSKGRPEAHALVDLMSGLSGMAFLARRQLAARLRQMLHRVIRIRSPLDISLPQDLTASQIGLLLRHVSAGGTQTRGIIEQRVVDALTHALHPEAEGWRPRGLGDSVNANNLSRRKLGDVDYQRVEDRIVVAYEPHSGCLSPIYIEAHERSLTRALSLRVEELEGVAEASQWKVKVRFVSHDTGSSLPEGRDICGVPVSFAAETFSDLVRKTCELDLGPHFRSWVLDPLNDRRTPRSVRERLLEIIGAEGRG